ncbi:hypothetical protein Tco_0776198 [Tanacetum coccineum]
MDYSSSSDSDPTEDSLPQAPELPLVSPFLCSDDSEADSESDLVEQRPKRHESLAVHDAMVSRRRDRVASRPSSPSGSSSHDTLALSSEFPIALVVAPPEIRRRPTILFRPGETIPFGQPYRTHRNGPRKLLTARKRVGPFTTCRLAWRRVSHRSSDHHSSPDFTLDSSSFGSSSDYLLDTSLGSPSDSLSDTSSVHSLGFDALSQTLSGPSTRVASSRLVYPLVMTPRYSEAFRRWRSAPLSTPYSPTTLELSLDSSSKRSLVSSSLSAGPSRKFRDSYSPKDSGEEHMEIGTADVEAVADLGIGDGVRVDTEDGIGSTKLWYSSSPPLLQDIHRSLFKRNCSKNLPRFSSNDMVHNHYLDEGRKKTQERDRNSKTSVIPSARFQSTADDSKPKPKSTNH